MCHNFHQCKKITRISNVLLNIHNITKNIRTNYHFPRDSSKYRRITKQKKTQNKFHKLDIIARNTRVISLLDRTINFFRF